MAASFYTAEIWPDRSRRTATRVGSWRSWLSCWPLMTLPTLPPLPEVVSTCRAVALTDSVTSPRLIVKLRGKSWSGAMFQSAPPLRAATTRCGPLGPETCRPAHRSPQKRRSHSRSSPARGWDRRNEARGRAALTRRGQALFQIQRLFANPVDFGLGRQRQIGDGQAQVAQAAGFRKHRIGFAVHFL